ncbi:MAG: dehydrogenase [Planctomycetes bacterium]|nr:dehydrogenase [Planctomycetota bacterium]
MPGEAQPPLPAAFVLPAAPALSPEDALAAFVPADGLIVELVAAEPLLHDPVQAVFDGDGRLWVVEMPGFMRDADGRDELEPSGCIAVLSDADGDGRLDTRAVFLDGLVLPRAVAPAYDGALVLAPPELLFCRDRDGDGRADERVVVESGFSGLDNPEHAPNALLRTLDNRYRLANDARQYRFDGTRFVPELTNGGGQWGLTQDDQGRTFHDNNSDPLRGDLVPAVYGRRNVDHGAVPGLDVRLADDFGVFPVRATPGVNRGYREGVLDAAGRLRSVTAACAPHVLRGGGVPADMRGDVIVCEPSANLLMRYELVEDPSGALAARPPATGRTPLASRDERFRPVNLCDGPDGALYVVDLARGVLQHRVFLTSWLRAQIEARGLEQPVGRGRIWRLRAHDMPPRDVPHLLRLDVPGLAALLAHEDGWWRDRAQQELVERRADDADTVPAVRARLDDPSPRARLHALWTLDGLGALEAADLLPRTSDADLPVRLAALRLTEGRVTGDDDALLGALAHALDDPSPRVRIQALFSLGAAGVPGRRLLARAMDADCSTPERRGAVLSGLRGVELEFLDLLDGDEPAPGRDVLLALLARAVTREGSGARLVDLLGRASRESQPWRARALLDGVLDGLGPDGRRTLFAEPAALGALLASDDADVATRAARLDAALAWPGRAVADAPPVRPLSADEAARFEAGRLAFAVGCTPCHLASGRGEPGRAPSLVGSPYVLGDPARLARLVLHGLTGPLDLPGGPFDQDMPAYPADDETLAALLTYLRREWGHGADPVAVETVSAARAASAGREDAYTADALDAEG